jgi:hypothetical protein
MTTLIPDEEELLDRAYRAYYRRCQREGWAYQFPASAKSLVQGNRAVLRNSLLRPNRSSRQQNQLRQFLLLQGRLRENSRVS